MLDEFFIERTDKNHTFFIGNRGHFLGEYLKGEVQKWLDINIIPKEAYERVEIKLEDA